MTLKTAIRDGHNGTGSLAGVTDIGELVVGGFANENILTTFNAMNAANTSFNFYPPSSNMRFVITTIFFDTPAPATNIVIYEADTSITTTPNKIILTISISGKNFFPITFPFGGFPTVTSGEFLNAKTDNATVNMTIMGYYVPIN
ncbi:MAG: hypothetical protein O8C67_05050 [Candidatus Methanoperedens sp.]|nr:hypothetical protein [Candidatus Methanoperedens sp.]